MPGAFSTLLPAEVPHLGRAEDCAKMQNFCQNAKLRHARVRQKPIEPPESGPAPGSVRKAPMSVKRDSELVDGFLVKTNAWAGLSGEEGRREEEERKEELLVMSN